MLHATGLPNSSDRIAIVGIGCALPGGIDSPEALWRFLREGRDAVVEVPPERWNVDAVYDPRPGTPGKTVTRWAGLLDDIAAFDAGFFGISPREAAVMDPQQRLLLEVAWRALEDAGIAAETLGGSNTGVYVGVSHSDYHAIQQFGRRHIDIHSATGGALSIVANRLSHRLDLRGPSLAIDTACSSSLVALDAACTALLNDRCETALVGGVNVMLTPDVTITFSRAAMLSPDGRCKAFDARANGYVRGEGAGMVILKPLARALRDRDRIHAVIRATAVNQDGHTSTITVPNVEAQVAMLRQACTRANVQPARVGYVEAHGTGTAVGDPIEAEAIGTVFGVSRTAESACFIGSIKTNIGHLEPAAGIAGLIKATLCVERGEIPPNLHFNSPNPHIDFARLGIRVPCGLITWPPTGGARLAAVNSFGFGGTNACAILEEPPQATVVAFDHPRVGAYPVLVPVSAATKSAVATLCGRVADSLDARPDESADIAATLALRRSHLEYRMVALAPSTGEVAQVLRDFAAGIASTRAVSGRRSDRRLAFVFTGQGSQWWGMGRGLLVDDPVFREAVERCDAVFAQRAGWSLIEQLTQPEERSRINETIVAQPAIFAVQVGLAKRLAAWGIKPEVVIGHSIGEIAAAYVAGALTLSQAVDVVYHRSRLQERSRLQGGMAALGIAAERAQAYLDKFGGQLELAAINGPELVSVAGPRALLDRFVAEVKEERQDVLCQILRVDYAFHSWQMDPYTAELRDSLRDLRPGPLGVPMLSSVTGVGIEGEQLDAAYWSRNMRQPVVFKQAIEHAIDSGIDTFLELGAHPALAMPIQACLAGRERDGLAFGTLHRERRDTEAIVAAAAALHVNGVSVDWGAFVPSDWKLVDVPAYPWEKQVHWVESEESRAVRFDGPVHPLLGYRLKTTEAIWQSEIDAGSPSYLNDHRIESTVVFPAAGYIELMLAAARETLGPGPHEIEAVTFDEALFLKPQASVRLQTSVDETRGIVRVHSRERADDSAWVLRATGRIRSWSGAEPVIERWAPKVEPPVQVGQARFYRDLADEGHAYGAAFQCVETLWYAEGCALGKIVLPASITEAGYIVHPSRLDACIQVVRGFRGFGSNARIGAAIALPCKIERMRLFRQPSGAVFARAKVIEDTASEITADIDVFDDAGYLVATIDGIRFVRIGRSDAKQEDSGPHYYSERWIAMPRGEVAVHSDLTGTWLILADRAGVAERLGQAITTNGGHAVLLFSASRDRSLDTDRFETTGSTRSLARIMAGLKRPPTRVVHLWGLDRPARLNAAGVERTRRLAVDATLALVRALVDLPIKPRLWVATMGAANLTEAAASGPSLLHAGLTGFLRSLANEQPELAPTLIDLDPDAVTAEALLDEIVHGSETEVALRGNQRFAPRLEACAETALSTRRRAWDPARRTSAFRVGMSTPGAIENLDIAAIESPDPGQGEVAVEVHAVGLNFRDIMAATGLLPAEAEAEPAWQRLGFECAGVVVRVGAGVAPDMMGRRVVAVAAGCMASRICVAADKVFPIPRRMSFADAAAIPVAFATAHYALVTLGRLKRGERVLIHAAAGGVGLAAVSIAHALGADVLATAGSHEKRAYLYQRGVAHVFDSRSLAFADDVLWKTDGRGVDVVLNSLPGPFLEKSLSLLAPGGRFLEIGKRDIYGNAPLNLYAMRNNAAFYAIDLAKIAVERPEVLRREIEAVMADLANRRLDLVPVTQVPVSRVTDAFRRMWEAQHIGKIVISFADKDVFVAERGGRLPIISDATYMITGGTGGFGLETARWLAENGARSLVLVGRSTPSVQAKHTIADLRATGTAVEVVAADVATRSGAWAALAAAKESGRPLRGIIHAAGAIDDALISNLMADQIERVFAGKVLGAWHLHALSRSLPLDFFVLYSSIAAVLGSPGQAHYAAANCMLKAIAALRRALGLPANAIAFGPVSDHGYLARRADVARYMDGVGVASTPAAGAFMALAAALRHPTVDLAFGDIDWSKLARSFALVATSPRTANLVRGVLSEEGSADCQSRAAILDASDEQRRAAVTEFLHGRVAAVLKVDASAIELDRPLHELGLDSLTAFELKNRIEADLGITLPVGQFLQRPTTAGLVPAILATLRTASGQASESAEADNLGLAMSIGQEALWFVDRLDPGNPAYGLAVCLSFRPHLNKEYIDPILERLVVHNENLRFVFPSDGIGPVPRALAPEQYRAIWHEATELTDAEFAELLQREANRPFDLEQDPLCQVHLFRRRDRDVMLFHYHHIVVDSVSIAHLINSVVEGYLLLQARLPLPAATSRAQFRQFVAWQRDLVTGPRGERHRDFWRQQLAGAPPTLPLSTDRPRPARPLGPGSAQNFKVAGPVVEELKGLARAQGATLFAVLLTAFNVLLHRHSGATDIVVGAPMSGRTRPEFEQIIGYLVNALPIRTRLSADQIFTHLLAEVDNSVRAALEHQDYPFPAIVRDIAPVREPGHLPVFQVMFGMERLHATDRRGYAATLLNVAGPAIHEREFTVESVAIERHRAPADITFTIEEFNDQIFAVVDYRHDLWEADTITQLIDGYQAILHEVVAAPARKVGDFLPLLHQGQPIHGPELHDRPDVIVSLCTIAAVRPDAIAVTDAAGDLAYGALLTCVQQVAGVLAARGIGGGARVGICVARSRDLPVALLAALALGAAYVPLDPSYPPQRLAAIIADAAPDIVIADAFSAAALPQSVPLLLTEAFAAATDRVAAREAEIDDLAYVIHTSGSTGRPIGVEVCRGALANFLAAMRRELPMSSNDTLLAVTPYSFDIAVLELLLPITLGARVVIAEEAVTRDGRLLATEIERQGITVLQATPATWQMLLDAGWEGARMIALCGGEALPPVLATRLLARTASLFNLYGPTEATVWSTVARITDAARPIPIGYPIANTVCLVVDDALKPVGPGVTGELLIGGLGLAHGYRNDPARTAERFITDPRDPHGTARMFRTGDHVRARPDGMLQFVGRYDQQVKVRGFRIELGEVEAVLHAQPSVRDAAVVALGQDLLDRRLAACVVLESESPGVVDALAAALRARLPSYMVPSIIRTVSQLPRLPNGKVDRRQVTALAQDPVTPVRAGDAVSRSPVEVELARVLEELLNLESVPRDADFFALGGTSLLGMRYVIRINDIFRINLGAADLVRAPTIALMAQLVADRLSADVMEPSARLGTASDAAIGQKLWRPLALARAEGAFDEINAAAVIYLPDDLLEQARRLGAESSLRRQLPTAEDAQWVAVARLPFGRIALVLIPRFGSDLIANPAGAVAAVDAAAQQAQRLGAKTAALTGIIPTITDFGRALTPPADLTITTGHGTTASAIVLTSLAAAQAAGRFLPGETVAFVGLGAIGSATLRLMLDLAIHPRALVLCDVPAKRAELERLAAEAADGGFRGETIIACAGARLSEDVYRASFIVGATNAPGLLAVDQLARGTIVVDDSFPHCFDVTNAMARMATQRDVLLVEGGLVSPPGTIDWQMALPPSLTLFGGGAAPNLLPDATTITGCILSSLLSDHACATVGPVSVAHSRAHWDAMARLGIGSAPLRCAGWLPGDAYLDQFRARFGRTGG